LHLPRVAILGAVPQDVIEVIDARRISRYVGHIRATQDMSEMKIILKFASALFLFSLAGVASAVTPPARPQKHPCHDDAFRFCGKDIPNHAKIHACLLLNVDHLSPACRAIISPGPKT
jgi:hypothetical protein